MPYCTLVFFIPLQSMKSLIIAYVKFILLLIVQYLKYRNGMNDKYIYTYYIRSRPDIKFRSFRDVIDFLCQNWRFVLITHEDDFIVVRENLRTGTRVMFEQSFATIANATNNN